MLQHYFTSKAFQAMGTGDSLRCLTLLLSAGWWLKDHHFLSGCLATLVSVTRMNLPLTMHMSLQLVFNQGNCYQTVWLETCRSDESLVHTIHIMLKIYCIQLQSMKLNWHYLNCYRALKISDASMQFFASKEVSVLWSFSHEAWLLHPMINLLWLTFQTPSVISANSKYQGLSTPSSYTSWIKLYWYLVSWLHKCTKYYHRREPLDSHQSK